MRMSKKLGKRQAELDFIDIDPDRDTPLYLDPQLIAASPHPFAEACHAQVEGFFQHFLNLLKAKHFGPARELFGFLHEPNETCLGQSTDKPSGRGIGRDQADQLFESIKKSKAATTGILEHVEDCAIFIPGIGGDKVSDMTTNIIRGQLIEYTREQCALHRVPMRPNTAMGPIWDNNEREWINIHTDALVLKGRPILLVPKNFVSFAKTYTMNQYHRHFVLEFHRRDQLQRNGPFVHRRKTKKGKERVWVVKKEIQENIAPADKDWVSDFTLAHANVFKEFKKWSRSRAKPLTNEELKGRDEVAEIAEYLAEQLRKTQPGNDAATAYHDLVLSILELLFYPSLTHPRKEQEIHDGRKRIDITFDNSARGGFFWGLHSIRHIPSSYIMVECKNYGREVGNPEIDQLAGRFSVNRGQVGMLMCRSLQDREKLIKRCQDTYRDHRGLLLPLTDEDILNLLEAKKQVPSSRPEEDFLQNLAREVALA